MKQGRLARRVTMALLSGTIMMPLCFGGTAQAEEATYDFGTSDVYADKVAEPPKVEEKAAPPVVEEETEEDAYPGGEISKTVQLGALGNRKAMDTPFSITGFTEEKIDNSQSSLLADLIANDASVSNQTLSGVSSAWNIRGFKSQQQDVQLNGLYGVAPRFYGGTEAAARVDILKGPSVLLAGIAPNGSVGGTINYVTKRAGDKPETRVSQSYGDGQVMTNQIDIGRRTDDGKAGVHLTVLNRGGETSFGEGNRTSSFALGADYKADRWRVELDYGLVYNKVSDQQYQLTIAGNMLSSRNKMFSVPNGKKFGAPGTYRVVHEHYGMIHGEYDFSKDWTGYLSYGLRRTTQETFFNNFQLTKPTGDVTMKYSFNNQINQADSAEIGVRGKLWTGDLKHELTLAANRIHYTRSMRNRTVKAGVKTNIWNTNFQVPNNPFTFNPSRNDENTFTGISLADIMTTKDERWQFILGGRQQHVEIDTYNINTGARKTHYDDSVFTPAFAVVYKPQKNLSLYANYMQGLDAGDALVTNTSAANYGEAFAPFKTKQYEVGVKYDLGKWAATLAAFDIKSPTLIEDTATHIFAPTGEVHHRGIELNAFGEPVKGTRITGGLMLLDATYEGTNGGIYDGNQVAATSRWNAVLGVEHDLRAVPGLTLTTHLTYSSKSYINEANSFEVDSWLTWDLGARYKFNAGKVPMTLRADIYNVTNRNYWRALSNNGVFLGKERTFMLSLSADF